MEAKQFHNFTTADFTWKWDGVPYTFKAGVTMFLEDYKADHFAKHLIDRELNEMGQPTNSPLRNGLEAQCFPSDEVITPLEALQVNKQVEPKVKKVEKEFEDLQEGKKK